MAIFFFWGGGRRYTPTPPRRHSSDHIDRQGVSKKCSNYKIASRLDICKITDTNSNQKLI